MTMVGISRAVVSGVLAAGLALAAGCGPEDEGPETGLEALYRLDHDFLSRRGAHTYIEAVRQHYGMTVVSGSDDAADADAPDANDADNGGSGGSETHVIANSLYVREYSDLMSHFGLYKPIMSPIAEPSADMGCEIDERDWYPFETEQIFECADGAVSIEAAYIGGQDFAVRIAARDDFTGDAVVVRGCAYDNGDGQLNSSLEIRDGVLFLTQEATLYSFWGVEAHEKRAFTIRAYAYDHEIPLDYDGLCWIGVFPADQTTVVTFRVQQDWAVGESLTAMSPSQEPPIDSVGFSLSNIDVEDELVAWFKKAPISDRDDEMSMMSWFLLWENTAAPWGERWKHEVVVPSKRHYFRGAWLWDAAFIAVALANGNADARELGVNQIRNIVENAADDGRFPREVWAHDAGTGYQPPAVLTWAAWDLADACGDDGILDEFYDALVKNHHWFELNTDTDGDGRCEWTREDSGMDTSPRFDDGAVEGVDLQAWMTLDADLLGRIAERLGRTGEIADWQAEAADRRQDIQNHFWDATDGMFYDLKIDDDAADPFVRVITPTTFIPLFAGAATQAQADAVAAHLADPAYFAAPYGLPTVPTTDPEYERDNYWRGPTWIVTNAMAIWGLERYALVADADSLRQSTLAMMSASETPWEYYDSWFGLGIGAPDFMWSGVFYMLLKDRGLPLNEW